MAKLRAYQANAISLLNNSIRQGNRRIILCVPTGGGKSTIASSYTKLCVKHDKRVLFMVHSKELVEQFANRLREQFNMNSSVIMSGVKQDLSKPVQVASVQTLVNRNKPKADLVIIDECHRAKAKTYQKILEFYPNAIIVGLTATPFRADGKPLGDIFEDIVHPIKIRELIKLKHLVPTKVIAPKMSVDMSGVKTVAGEYHKGQMLDKFADGGITRGVVNNYIRHAKGKRTIVFNCSVEHSKSMHELFTASNIKSAHLDGTTSKEERSRIVAAFASGNIDVLNSVDIFTEGFDIPATEVVILNRATKSEGLYVQMVGRGLRPADGKVECLVLDHGGNTLRFGYVEDYDQVDFDLKSGKETQAKGMICKSCNEGVMRYNLSTKKYKCVSCGNEYDTNQKRRHRFSDECEFEVLDRDVLMVQRLVDMPNWKAKEKLPASQIRLYQLVKGYKKGWILHTALMRFEDLDIDDIDVWMAVNYRLKLAEVAAGTHELYKTIKEQHDEKNTNRTVREDIFKKQLF